MRCQTLSHRPGESQAPIATLGPLPTEKCFHCVWSEQQPAQIFLPRHPADIPQSDILPGAEVTFSHPALLYWVRCNAEPRMGLSSPPHQAYLDQNDILSGAH